MLRLSEVEINVEWTLDSMRKTWKKEEYINSTCFGCSTKTEKAKEYIIAVKANNMMWQDGSGPVWVKEKIIYCDRCAAILIHELEPTVTLE